MIKVELPCKPMVKAYLKRYTQNGKIVIDQSSRIGKYIFAQAEKMPNKHNNRPIRYSSSVVIHLPFDLVLRYGTFLTRTAITNINNQVTDLMYDEIFLVTEAIQNTTEKRYVLTEALELYCKKKNIDSSLISIGNVRKQWFRYQQSSNTLKINA